jgi:hypothetical protein
MGVSTGAGTGLAGTTGAAHEAAHWLHLAAQSSAAWVSGACWSAAAATSWQGMAACANPAAAVLMPGGALTHMASACAAKPRAGSNTASTITTHHDQRVFIFTMSIVRRRSSCSLAYNRLQTLHDAQAKTLIPAPQKGTRSCHSNPRMP